MLDKREGYRGVARLFDCRNNESNNNIPRSPILICVFRVLNKLSSRFMLCCSKSIFDVILKMENKKEKRSND